MDKMLISDATTAAAAATGDTLVEEESVYRPN